MVGQPFEQHRLTSPPMREYPREDETVDPAIWLRRGAIAVVIAGIVGFAATLGAAMAFDDHPTACTAPDGGAACCHLQAQDEFAARLCDESR